MNKEEIMKKYREGSLDAESVQLLEKYIEDGLIELNEIEEIENLHKKLPGFDVEPSTRVSDRFYTYLAEQSAKSNRSSFSLQDYFANLLGNPRLQPVILASLFVLIFASGISISSIFSSQKQISSLNTEIESLRETMVLSMIEQASTTDRLKAVHLSEQTGLQSQDIAEALLNTFNNDESTNVRLAALEVLIQYLEDPFVREGLIRSISNQTNPIIQLHLIDIMTAINARGSASEFEKLLDGSGLEPEVRTKMKETVESFTQI